MRAHAVIKTSFLSIGALLATLLVSVSVAQGKVSARTTSAHFAGSKTTITSQPLQKKTAPVLVALAQSSSASALLPVVSQPSIHANQQILANDVLLALPSLCRDNLKNFYVLYKGATSRGLGGKTTIIIDGTSPDNEFIGLMVHECGHVIHGNLLGNIATGASGFKDGNDTFAKDSPAAAFFAISWMTPNVMKAGLTDKDFVSGYAKTNCFEDFAETFTAYVLERPWMEIRAQADPIIAAKLHWMETNLPLSSTVLDTGTEKWSGKVPWDATKLAFNWGPAE